MLPAAFCCRDVSKTAFPGRMKRKKGDIGMRSSLRSFLYAFFLGLLSFGIPALAVCAAVARRFFAG